MISETYMYTDSGAGSTSSSAQLMSFVLAAAGNHNQPLGKKPLSWKIKNFDVMRSLDTVLSAQETTFDTGDEIGFPTKWKFWLNVNEYENQEKWIGLYTKILEFPKNKCMTGVHVHVRVYIQNSAIFPCQSAAPQYYTFDNHFDANATDLAYQIDQKRFGFAKFIPQQDAVSGKILAIPDHGTLQIVVMITMFDLGNANPPLEAICNEYDSRFMETFFTQLNSIRKNPTEVLDTTTTVISQDGKEFPVNRVILAARSSVFRRMFQAKMSESESGLVKVEDMTAVALNVLLEFCHTGKLNDSWKDADVIECLVYGADKYMLDDLMEFLDKAMGLVCTMENCEKLLSLARTYKLKEAEAHLFQYLKAHGLKDFDEVIQSVESVVG